MVVEVAKRLFTVEEYYQMAEAGIVSEDDRVELIAGEIVEMSPIGSRHAACVKRVNPALSQRLGDEALISVQDPIHLSEYSEPEPDLALLQPRSDFYAEGHPGPRDVLLVVEVAETSAHTDRTLKVPLYAQAGIQEVWLVDLAEGYIEVYRDPSQRGYGEIRRQWRGERLSPQSFPDAELAVDDVLG